MRLLSDAILDASKMDGPNSGRPDEQDTTGRQTGPAALRRLQSPFDLAHILCAMYSLVAAST